MASFKDFTVGAMIAAAQEHDCGHVSYLMRNDQDEPVVLVTATLGPDAETFRYLLNLFNDASEEAVSEAIQILTDSIEGEKIQ